MSASIREDDIYRESDGFYGAMATASRSGERALASRYEEAFYFSGSETVTR